MRMQQSSSSLSSLSRLFTRTLVLSTPVRSPLNVQSHCSFFPSLLPSSASLPQPVRLRSAIVQNRAKKGLFAGRHIRFGNSVSHSHQKTRRTWSPNVQVKYYYSDLLQERLRLHVTTHAMRCIDKAGGLDDYLLYTPTHHLGEGLALRLRERLQAAYRPIKNRREMEERLKRKAERIAAAAANPPQLDATAALNAIRAERARVSVAAGGDDV